MLMAERSTRYGRSGKARRAVTVVVHADHSEVVADALLQNVHVERVRRHFLGDVLDQDVPQAFVCKANRNLPLQLSNAK